MENLTCQNLLTIAIPTYNRNEILLQNLEMLLPQMVGSTKLLIIDNQSSTPVIETIGGLINRFNNLDIKIIRNDQNIGGNANVLRCIEYADSEYIWILGDDDFPANGALEKIIKKIEDQTVIWVNFHSNDSCQPIRSEASEHHSLQSFLNALSSISELVFVSVNIYKTSHIKKGLEFGNSYQEMMAPHLVSMISGIERACGEKGIYIISSDELFRSITNNQDNTTSWPLYKAFIGIMSMYRIPFNADNSRLIGKLVRGARVEWLSNKSLVIAFSKLSLKYGIKKSLLMSADFIVSLLVVDRLMIIASAPLYIISIFFGKLIISIHKPLKDSIYSIKKLF